MDCGTIKGARCTWRVLWDEDTHEVYIRDIQSGFEEYIGKATTAREAVAKADTHIHYS